MRLLTTMRTGLVALALLVLPLTSTARAEGHNHVDPASIVLQLGSSTAQVGGVEVKLDVPPSLAESRTCNYESIGCGLRRTASTGTWTWPPGWSTVGRWCQSGLSAKT